MKSGCEQDDVPVDLNPVLPFSPLYIRHGHRSPLRDVGHIQADRLAEKHGKRHPINGQPVRPHMVERIHMGSHMFDD